MMQWLGKSCPLFLIFILSNASFTHAGNVLVLPGEYSHWQNMRNIVDELLNRNHTVTVLVCSASPTINFTQQERFQYLVFKVPLSAQELDRVTEELINIWMQHPSPNRLQTGLQVIELLGKVRVMHRAMCDSMLRNDALIAQLSALKFDVLFNDPMFMCADLLAEMLDLPIVLSIRASPGFSMERMCGQMPAPPSFVPLTPTVLTDRMCFMERVQNMIASIVYSVAFHVVAWMGLDSYYTDVLGKQCH